jgi:lipooligosaccharide transport system ATP-binding protein
VPAPVIHAEELVKAYDTAGEHDHMVVDGLSLDILPGESFGILGARGAGTSTTVRLLAAAVPRTGGRLEVLGLDPDDYGPEVRSRLGLVPQRDDLEGELTPRETLVTHARLFGIPPRVAIRHAKDLLAEAHLDDVARQRTAGLGPGLRRRLQIARALVNDPRILLVDSPTEGLGPRDRAAVHHALKRASTAGVTLVLATRDGEEAERLCERVAILDDGRILAVGAPDELVRDHTSREVLELRFGVARTKQAARQLFGIGDRMVALADRVLLYADNGERVSVAVIDRGLQPVSSLIRRSNLGDVFLRLTGRTLTE